MKFIIAQILGVICSILSISVTQFKSLKHILIGEIVMNILFGLNYLLLDGISGTLVCLFATVHTILVYVHNKEGKKLPFYITAFFVTSYAVVTLTPFFYGISAGGEILTVKYAFKNILPLISALLFTSAIGQSKTIGYRLIKGTNTIMWLLYDLCVFSYGSLISRFLNLASHTIAILRHDIKKK